MLDRGLTNLSIDEFIQENNAFNHITEIEPYLELKINIANQIKVPWFFVIYSYKDKKCLLYDLTNMQSKYLLFNSFGEFGVWFSQYTDASKRFSAYQESGLPQFDVELRSNGTPWPGNIDGILFISNSKQMLCILEYQNTSATTVRLHDNNKYIYATPYRKGDNKRWMVQDKLSKALNLKVLILVWSLQEKIVGLKLVDSFSTTSDGLVTKINWGKIEFIPIDDLSFSDFIKILK